MTDSPTLEGLFHEARSLAAGGERESFLSAACGQDVGLRAQVDALLRADADDGGLLREPEDAAAGPGETPGQRIDRYKLLEQIGEGGMGTVWMAEQREPVKRHVALKVIKLGMDTKQVIARFEAERQALAMMDHPNIARVLDAGATDAGRPFFVMELVKGVPLLEYCDGEALTTRERLALFVTVCHAIQHAHQKGIVHRDIKPANVLVTLHDGVPVPKVIDFGIAKATDQELTQKTLFTGHRQIVGTPAYMAPEQAELSGLDIDTRADVYSLGVLLYELLTGTTPFDVKALRASGYEELLRAIREDVPHKPSSRVSTQRDAGAARLRRTDVQKLRSSLRGDLDWVVMKCLEKDRARRYESADGLAADVQRYLRFEPVVARPPSLAYQFQKLVQRHRAAVLTSGAALALLVLGVVGTSAGLLWALRERGVSREQVRRSALAATSLAYETGEYARGRALLQEVPAELRDWIWELLAARVDEPLMAFEGDSLAYTTDGRLRTVTARGVEEWSANGDSRLLARLDLAEGDVVHLTPRGASVVIQSADAPEGESHFRVLEAASGTERAHFVVRPKAARLLVGERRLACATVDGLQVWDLRTGEVVARSSGSSRSLPLAWSPGEDRLAVGGSKVELQILDGETLTPAEGFRSPGPGVLCAAFSGDGLRLAAAQGVLGADLRMPRELVVWNALTGEQVSGLRVQVPQRTYSLAFTPDGDRVAVRTHEKVLIVETETCRVERTIAVERAVPKMAFGPDGSSIAILDSDGAGSIWAVRETGLLVGHESFVYPLAFSPDGRRLVSGSWRGPGSIRVWDAETGARVTEFGDPDSSATSLTFAPDGAQFATCGIVKGLGARLRVWDAATGAVTKELVGGYTGCVISPDGRLLAALRGPDLVLIDRETWGVTEMPALGSVSGAAPAFSPDGRRVAAARSGDFDVVVGDVATLATLTYLRGHTETVNSIRFSADGSRILTASSDDGVRVWDAVSGELLTVLEGPHTDAMCALFAPDGEHVISGGRDGRIRFWDIASAAVIAELVGHGDYVYSLALSPDGKTLASSSGDRTVRMWRTESSAETRRALEARRELVAELTPRVVRLLDELEHPSAVALDLRADREGTGWERRLEVALQVALGELERRRASSRR